MSLARNSMLLVVGRSVASLARLVVNLLVARHFGEAGFLPCAKLRVFEQGLHVPHYGFSANVTLIDFRHDRAVSNDVWKQC